MAQVQSPEEFFPHPYTEEFTQHHLIVDYYQHVAQASPMVQLVEYGRTNEHRPLVLAFVSSEQNLRNLDAIRTNNLRLAGLSEGEPDMDAARLIVWLSYSVHGNESAGTEAAPRVLYDLVTGANGAHAWLENTVVILDPCINPDGFNRYVNWNAQVSSKSFDSRPVAREHDEPWPGGRVNHYLFDLNRDWAWQTQIESQQRMVEYRRWMPQVHVDLHEMGYTSPYYFAPAAEPYHPYITDWQRDFQVTIGRNNARYFDENGWRYFTKEVFDLFYPSYGDTYPTYNGAIGMTYEQGGSGFAGRAIDLPHGDTLFLADRIAHHTTTSLSTIEISSQNKGALLEQFRRYFADAQANPPGPYRTFVIKGSNATGKLQALTHLLERQGIVYGRPQSGAGRSYTGFNYRTGSDEAFTLSADDLVVSAFQPRSVLTQILFEPEGDLVDSLSYDITAWALPHAYGVEAFALKDRINVLPGYRIAASYGQLPEAYAYALRWESLREAKFLAAALREGLRPRFATEAFSVGGESFAAGTVIFMQTEHRNVRGWLQTLQRLHSDMLTPLVPIQTGFVDSGKDLGSSSYRLIQQPRIVTVAGERVSTNGFGQVWYLFEQVLDYPVTVVDVGSMGSVDWDDFNILVLPEGFYSISENTMNDIKSWVRGGGKVIAIGSALRQFADKDGFALKTYAEDDREKEVERALEREELDLRLEPYASGRRRSISHQIPGAVFHARVDVTHPLGFGLGKDYFTLKTSARSYEHLTDAVNAVYLGDAPQHYGFAGSKALERVANSVVFAAEQSGRGAYVYMTDNPLFRAFWENGKFAFCNALFFAGN